MAAPKLTTDIQGILLEWLAADYSGPLIKHWFKEHKWPELSDATLSYYREKWKEKIEAARIERRASAINSGLALKEERVKRLTEHADELDAIKWLPDEKGRLWNEKAWRETLDDIAKEMGHRRTGSTNLNMTPDELRQMSDDDLADLERKLTNPRTA